MQEKREMITKTDVARKLQELKFSVQEIIPESTVVASSPYIDAASVLIYYDPVIINPVGKGFDESIRKEMINELIGNSDLIADSNEKIFTDDTAKIYAGNYKLLFTLKESVRRKTLSSIIKKNRIAEAMSANENINVSSRTIQSLFNRILLNEKIELKNLSLEELDAACRLITLLEGVNGLKLPKLSEIINRKELVEMLSPFKHLTGIYEDGKFVEKFRGRQKELASLRKYVGVLPPKGVVEYIDRFVSSVFFSDKNPLLIFGLGGTGKSTLLSKFILEHHEAHKKDRFPFVYLDFDRPHLNALEPETLLIEAARQLSIQFRDMEDLSKKFASFHTIWSGRYATLVESGTASMIMISSTNQTSQRRNNKDEIEKEFLELIKMLYKIQSRPFLIVLDTFEEVQYKGHQFVLEVLGLFDRLKKQYSKLRTVIAGRAPVKSVEVVELELGNLDTEAAEAFLLGIGISDTDTAKLIVKKIGGNPLTLKLAAEFVKDKGYGLLADLDIDGQLNEVGIQGLLYRRILEHLHDPEVRKLAHPGMILRRITPEIIWEVLREPCGLELTSLDDAKKLFNEIKKEVALVTQSEELVLRHRSDLRKVMYKLIMESKAEQAIAIHKLAIKFYQTGNSNVNKAEEFYHRLALGESPRQMDLIWIDGIEKMLLNSVDELPDRAKTFILAKAGLDSTDETIWELADLEDKERHFVKQANDLLNSGMAERALSILDKFPTGNNNYTPILLQVKALWQLKRYSEAVKLTQGALDSFYSENMPYEIRKQMQHYVNISKSAIFEWNDDIINVKGNKNDKDDDQIGGSNWMTSIKV
jgi:hypothetical protein